MGREWTLPLTVTVPLSMNDRGHWRTKNRVIRGIRDGAALAARDASIPTLAGFTVELHYVPRDKRRRDPENLIATLKPFVDGLVDAGVAPDDCPPYYSTTIPVIDPPNGKGGRLYAIVREVLPHADDAAHEQGDDGDALGADPWPAA
jgi:crossover junction endodeoxyribonuclease RusA